MSTIVSPEVDIYVNSDWVKLPSTKENGVRQSPPIVIVHGAKNEDLVASPTRATMKLDDTAGNYNRRNPMGAYHGSLNKNTPLRIRIPLAVDNVSQTNTDSWGTIPGNYTSPSGFTWTNGASSGGTIAATDWSRSGTAKTHSLPASTSYRETDLVGTESYRDFTVKYTIEIPVSNITGSALDSIYHLLNLRKEDANNYTQVELDFRTNEAVAIRIKDVVDGSSRFLLDQTVITGLSVTTDQKFWVNVSLDETIIRAKVWAFGDPEPLDWTYTTTRVTRRLGELSIRNGLDGNTNTKPVLIVIDNFSIEARPFTGEISNFSPEVADESLKTYSMGITATGPMQREEQGATPFKSPIYRELSAATRLIREGQTVISTATSTSFTSPEADASDIAPVGGFIRFEDVSYIDTLGSTLSLNTEDQVFTIVNKSTAAGVTTVGFTPQAINPPKANDVVLSSRLSGTSDLPFVFWPCNDQREATQVNSGLEGGAPMTLLVATPEFSSVEMIVGSEPGIKLNNAELYSALPDYDNSLTELTFHCLLNFPADEDSATGETIVQFYTDSPTGELSWELVYETSSSGDIRLRVTNNAGTILFQNVFGALIRGFTKSITLSLSESGGTTTYSLVSLNPLTGSGAFIDGTVTGVSVLGKASRLRINPGGGYVNVGISAISMYPSFMDNFNFQEAERAHLYDDIGYRLLRLSIEEDFDISFCSDPKQPSQLLGFQLTDTLLKNLREPVKVNRGGFFFESKDAYSFVYRTTPLIFNQDAVITIDFTLGGILVDFVPIDDDKNTRNDITVSRHKGGQLRITETEGTLSTLAPPDGVGSYTDKIDLMIPTDTHLQENGSWELHLGTVDEYRYSEIKIFPTETNVPLEKMFSIGVGSRIKITNAQTSAARVYDSVDQIVVGYTWNLHAHKPYLSMVGIPASPFSVVELDNTDYSIIDQEGSTLAEALDTTETAIDVSSPDGHLWATTASYPDAFPFEATIAKAGMTTGERVTVTACVGTTSPQTLTVVRGENNVSRTWDSGDSIFASEPVYLSM